MPSKSLPLYPELPSMKCDVGCGACCGVTVASKAEFKEIKQFVTAQGIHPLRQGLTCPFYQKGTCAVYHVRPMVCRMFGHHRKMECERGYNVNISDRREQEIMGPYMDVDKPSYLLHAFIYSDEEIMKLIDPAELAATERAVSNA